MTRLLVLFRHAKADRPSDVADFDRPLTDRGKRDARAAGEWLRSAGYVPDLVICSAARRARQTWKHAASALDDTPEVDYRRDVYDAGLDGLLGVIRSAPGSARVLAVVGHNPTIEMVSATLDPAGAAGGLRTGGIAVHTVDGDWRDLATAPVTAIATPRG